MVWLFYHTINGISKFAYTFLFQKKIENLEAELETTPSLKYKKLDIFVGIFQILLAIGLFAGAIAVAVLTV